MAQRLPLRSSPSGPGFDSRRIDTAEIYRGCLLEEREQRLDNFNLTFLALAS